MSPLTMDWLKVVLAVVVAVGGVIIEVLESDDSE